MLPFGMMPEALVLFLFLKGIMAHPVEALVITNS
jgi:hypothetical protein